MPSLRLAASEVDRAIRIILDGGVLAYPTDTVYGVGCRDAARLFEVKQRPAEKRIAFLTTSLPADFPNAARRLAAAFWPGALTIVSGDEAYRMPDHPLALALLAGTGPLPTTSANLSGHPATDDPDRVWEELGGRVDALLDGGRCPGGRESTVVTVDGAILREGAIPAAALERALRSGG
ncbi:MAG: L-threonylcarbamoyladenylate synthase [Chloroflexota bacterium]